MAISRMNMERQMRNMGGIMGLEDQRQGYFLGKLVKKITKPIKKIVKSPLGKMALLAGGAYFAGGGGLPQFLGGKGLGGFGSNAFGRGITSLLGKGKGLFDKGNLLAGLVRNPETGKFSLGRAALTGLGAASIAAPFFMGGDEEVDEGTPFTSPQADIEDIRGQAKAYYSDPTNSALYFMPPKSAVQRSFYAADGGLATMRPGYAGGQLVSPSGDGSRPGYAGPLDFFKNLKSGFDQIVSGETQSFLGGDQEGMNEAIVKKGYGSDLDSEIIQMIINMNKEGVDAPTISSITGADEKSVSGIIDMLNMNIEQKAYGGRIGKAEGGIMDLGGLEKDYREGGFVPLGAEERADDVPARLSKNEFVFTADAVRAAGQGDIDQGAEVMQNMMDNLEAGGTISEESQGMENPAQEMFDQSQMLESRIA